MKKGSPFYLHVILSCLFEPELVAVQAVKASLQHCLTFGCCVQRG